MHYGKAKKSTIRIFGHECRLKLVTGAGSAKCVNEPIMPTRGTSLQSVSTSYVGCCGLQRTFFTAPKAYSCTLFSIFGRLLFKLVRAVYLRSRKAVVIAERSSIVESLDIIGTSKQLTTTSTARI